MYTRRKKEINRVSAAYFTDIIIHYGFGERLRVFHAFLETLLRLLAVDCCCVAEDTLLSFKLKLKLKIFFSAN